MSATAYESLTVSTTAVGFTSATFGYAVKAFVTVEDAAVRFRFDGTAPTASVGHVAEAGDVVYFENPDEVQKVKFISRDGTTVTLRCSFLVA